MKRFAWLTLASLCLAGSVFAADDPKLKPSLEDLYSDVTIPDMAISPSGRYVAEIRKTGGVYNLITYDLKDDQHRLILRMDRDLIGGSTEAAMVAVYWKSDDRLLLRTRIGVDKGVNYDSIRWHTWYKLGSRLFAMNRDGSNLVSLLSGNHDLALAGAINLGSIVAWLPRDPNHIVMQVAGQFGMALFRVDLQTGLGEIVERPPESTIGWWLDVELLKV